jgi:transcription elongation factor GreA
MIEQPYLTKEGAEKLRKELSQLKGTAREEIALRLRSAIQMGDLSENADYHKAKEDQSFLEGRIRELEYTLSNAIIVDKVNTNRDIVEVGVKVTIQEDGDEPITYDLVGAKEANPRAGKISNESPIGRALIGKKAGDYVIVQTPNGEIRLKILNIH